MQKPAERMEDVLVLVGQASGHTVIPLLTPLTRLNYFDGKFLRADDLQAEQGYLRALVAFSNRGGGAGVIHGFDTVLKGGDTLGIGAGLAIDPAGRVLLLPGPVDVGIQKLIDASRELGRSAADAPPAGSADFGECVVAVASPPADTPRGGDLFLITIGHAEALCGNESVYGKLCEEACVTTTDRPKRVEGIVVRAVPLVLHTPLATSGALTLDRRHLRSRVASAYYADERLRVGSLISKAGLAMDTWCLGARLTGGDDVPLAVVAREGTTTIFLDAWIARRERIEAPARRYWAWRMAMRPWDVFLAQVLQFQCQLHDLFEPGVGPGQVTDPCHTERTLIADAYETLGHVEMFYKGLPQAAEFPTLAGGLTRLTTLKGRLLTIKNLAFLGPRNRVLIQGGIVELPPAGYLPVTPGEAVSVNAQVRRLLGEGVDLRFCVVRPDFVAHALEEAQHMERISLLEGLDHPEHKPKVDVLVPDGQLVKAPAPTTGTGFEARLKLTPGVATAGATPINALTAGESPLLHGAGRGELLPTGGGAFHVAAATEAGQPAKILEMTRGFVDVGAGNTAHVALLRTFASAEGAPAATAPEGIDAVAFTRIHGMATDAFRLAAEIRAGENPFVPPAEAETTALPKFTPAVPADRRVVNLWATMRSERNPFTLVPGDRTPVSLRAILAVPAAKPTVLEHQLHGDFEIVQMPAGGPGERRVDGFVSGVASLHSVVNGAAPHERTAAVRLPTTLVLRTPAAEPPSLEIRITHSQRTAWTIRTAWSGHPLQVEVDVNYLVGTQTVPLAAGRLKENPAVLVAGNPVHTLALAALDIIGAALAEPGFAEAARRILFPPPAEPSDEATVRATLDWVLFHRRRDKVCGLPEARPAPAAARRYQVYHVGLPRPEIATAIRAALLKNDDAALAQLTFAPVDVVEFAGGAPVLTSSPDAVRVDWQRVHPGNLLLYAAIASQGAAVGDGAVLATGRLARLEAALAPLTTLAPNAVAEVIPAVPARLAVAGTDGVIVLLTVQKVEKTCQDVFRVDQPELLDRLRSQLEGGTAAAVAAELARAAHHLGTVTFAAGTANVLDNTLAPVVTAWANAGTPAKLVVVARGGEQATVLTVYDQQANAVVQALGGTIQPERSASEIALPVCPSIVLVMPGQPRVGRLVAAVPVQPGFPVTNVPFGAGTAGGGTAPGFIVNFDASGALVGSLPSVFTAGGPTLFKIAKVELATVETPSDGKAGARLDAIFNAFQQVGFLTRNQAGTVTATKAVRVATATEKQNFETRDNVTANDIIFIELRPEQ